MIEHDRPDVSYEKKRLVEDWFSHAYFQHLASTLDPDQPLPISAHDNSLPNILDTYFPHPAMVNDIGNGTVHEKQASLDAFSRLTRIILGNALLQKYFQREDKSLLLILAPHSYRHADSLIIKKQDDHVEVVGGIKYQQGEKKEIEDPPSYPLARIRIDHSSIFETDQILNDLQNNIAPDVDSILANIFQPGNPAIHDLRKIAHSLKANATNMKENHKSFSDTLQQLANALFEECKRLK